MNTTNSHLHEELQRIQTGNGERRRATRRAETVMDLNDIVLDQEMELVVLAEKHNALRCRKIKSRQIVTVRSALREHRTPGEILTVVPRKKWTFMGHPYMTADIKRNRFDIPALNEEAQRVFDRMLWLNPSDNQGVRFLIPRIVDGQPWTPDL